MMLQQLVLTVTLSIDHLFMTLIVRWEGYQPVIHRLKELVKKLKQEAQIALYTDFHGHSRRFGAFMYGCTHNTTEGSTLTRLQDADEKLSRLFVEEMGQRSQRFDLGSCSFAVQPGKDSTGRVSRATQLYAYGTRWRT